VEKGIELSIILPAYRESESLRGLLPALKTEAARLTPLFEIVVVDAQSPVDDTLDTCRIPTVRHVFRKGGNNYGDAVRSGIACCRGKYVVFMDADGSHNPAHLARLWEHRQQADIIIGSRYTDGGSTENPKILIFMSFVVNVVYRLIFNIKANDVTNSFRLYRSAHLRQLTLDSDNFEIVEEILIRLIDGSVKATLHEVPITFEQRKAGVSKRNLFLFALSYVNSIVRLLKFRRSAVDQARREGS
jgi:dolichol-phosphate mannosyltransferase